MANTDRSKFPVIYVRGYAGSQNEVEDTVDDPFYGFNKGSTHIRVLPVTRSSLRLKAPWCA